MRNLKSFLLATVATIAFLPNVFGQEKKQTVKDTLKTEDTTVREDGAIITEGKVVYPTITAKDTTISKVAEYRNFLKEKKGVVLGKASANPKKATLSQEEAYAERWEGYEENARQGYISRGKSLKDAKELAEADTEKAKKAENESWKKYLAEKEAKKQEAIAATLDVKEQRRDSVVTIIKTVQLPPKIIHDTVPANQKLKVKDRTYWRLHAGVGTKGKIDNEARLYQDNFFNFGGDTGTKINKHFAVGADFRFHSAVNQTGLYLNNTEPEECGCGIEHNPAVFNLNSANITYGEFDLTARGRYNIILVGKENKVAKFLDKNVYDVSGLSKRSIVEIDLEGYFGGSYRKYFGVNDSNSGIISDGSGVGATTSTGTSITYVTGISSIPLDDNPTAIYDQGGGFGIIAGGTASVLVTLKTFGDAKVYVTNRGKETTLDQVTQYLQNDNANAINDIEVRGRDHSGQLKLKFSANLDYFKSSNIGSTVNRFDNLASQTYTDVNTDQTVTFGQNASQFSVTELGGVENAQIGQEFISQDGLSTRLNVALVYKFN